MIWYLLDEIKIIENLKNKVAFKVKVFLTYAIYFASQIFAVCVGKVYLAYIFDGIALILSIVYVKIVDKRNLKSIDSDYVKYKERINKFREILKKYELYSKEQVKNLIQLSNEQKAKWKLSEELAKPFNIIMVSLVMPTLILILNWLFNHTNVTNEMVQYAVAFITSIIVVIALGMMISPAVKKFTDREYFRFAKLNDYLQDVLLMDFSKD